MCRNLWYLECAAYAEAIQDLIAHPLPCPGTRLQRCDETSCNAYEDGTYVKKWYVDSELGYKTTRNDDANDVGEDQGDAGDARGGG